jgi:hypothetical protein
MPLGGEFAVSLIDRKSMSSVQRLPGPALTAGNIVAQSAAWSGLAADITAMSLGVQTRWSIANVTTAANPIAPTSVEALRKNKIALSYHDTTTGKKYTSQIPIATGAGMVFITGTDDLDMTVGTPATLKTDFEATVKALGVNAVVIDKMRAIGRHV